MDIRKSDLSRHNSEMGKSHGAKDSPLYKKICSKTFFIYKTSENEKKLLTGLYFLYAFHENLHQGLRPYTQTTFSPENWKGKHSLGDAPALTLHLVPKAGWGPSPTCWYPEVLPQNLTRETKTLSLSSTLRKR